MNSIKMFLRDDEVMAAPATSIGAKARELANGQRRGFAVPKFVAIPATVCERLLDDDTTLLSVAREAAVVLACSAFAVRSCALAEDGASASHAGVFKTVLDVSAATLIVEIRNVLEDARGKLGGSLSRFSLIIQEFIEPDYAGVVFTRDPRGRREMVVELVKGRGDQVVEGRAVTTTIRFNWAADVSTSLPGYPILASQVAKLKALELEYRRPLDIEWCVRGETFYFLQARPVTSIAANKYRELRLLDDILPKKTFFLYEKNTVTEIAPRPVPLAYELIQHLARRDGPIAKVYRKHGIQYTATKALRKIGTELFVDREAEARSLIPAAEIDRVTMKPALKLRRGWLRSIWNILALSILASRARVELAAQLREKLRDELRLPLENEFALALADFERSYEVIFEINLLSGMALRNAENILKHENVSMTGLLEADASLFGEVATGPSMNFDFSGLEGNGLDIGDESKFAMRRSSKQTPAEVSDWWNSRTPLRQRILAPSIQALIEFTRLREEGRWLTVRHIHQLRSCAKSEARRNQVANLNCIYGATIEELSARVSNEDAFLSRLANSNTYAGTDLPKFLTSEPIEMDSRQLGVSAGVARGRLVSRKEVAATAGELILFTDSLTPDLVELFPRIRGIVSNHGGLLSHLAILARESSLPVIVGIELSKGVSLGAILEIDGDRGEIRVLEKS